MSSNDGKKKIRRHLSDWFKLKGSQSTSIRKTYEGQNSGSSSTSAASQSNIIEATTNASSLANQLSVTPPTVRSSSEDILRIVSSPETEPIAETAAELGTNQSNIKEFLGIAGRFTQTLLKKLPDCIDSNPVKMALSIVKTIIIIKDEIGDNNDTLTESLQSAKQLLSDVAGKAELDDSEDVKRELKDYERKINEQVTQLLQITREMDSNLRLMDYENYKNKVNKICKTISETTTMFMLSMQVEIRKTTAKMHEQMKQEQQERRMASLQDLNPSRKADHRTVLQGQSLKRETCTEGTRIKILEDITSWANDRTDDSPRVFWLTGQAGSGKTTVAYTIAKRFEKGQPAVLGASFLCSRQFEETRSYNRVLPTIAYQLAFKSKHYEMALHTLVKDKSVVVDHDVSEQMQELLVGPWREAQVSDGSPTNLVIIDALDEISEDGGSQILSILLTTINQYHLNGLKFLVTSRTDPRIVELCQTFESKAVCRLQDVPIHEAEADIERYLDAKLPNIVGSPELTELRNRTNGLFIYAATAVRILTSSRSITYKEQMRRLHNLLSKPSGISFDSKDKSPIDELYKQILSEAFSGFMDEQDLKPRLQILFTFICAAERVSPSAAASLMDDDDELAQSILNDLHAVLYVQDNRVFWYHASFPDFLFAQRRSNFCIGNENFNFWCDEVAHHNLLAASCLRVLNSDDGLRFNMGAIRSSFLLDSDHIDEISKQVDKNIGPVLWYSILHWASHLCLPSTINDFNVISSSISEFLQIRALFWIEAMNLLGSVSDCSMMLQRARRWILSFPRPESQTYDYLYFELLEVENFSIYFSGSLASKSTPHLYISALATWKLTSWTPGAPIAYQWKSQFSLIPAFTHNGELNVPLLTIHLPNLAAVHAVAFSRDGTRIASGSVDGSVRIWDASSGKQLNNLKGHADEVNSVAFSSDDKWIASGSNDQTVRVWDVWTGEIISVMEGHTGPVHSVSFSKHGSWIVSGSRDTSIRVWDASTREVLRVLKGHTNWVNSVAFSDDGARIVSGSGDRSVRVWDASTGEMLKAIEGHTDYVRSAAFSSDGACIVSGSRDCSVRIWDTSTGELLRVLEGNVGKLRPVMEGHTGHVRSVHFSGDCIVSSSNDGTVRIWNSRTGEILNVIRGHTNRVPSVGSSVDGLRAVSGSCDGSLRIWDSSKFPVTELQNSFSTSAIGLFAFSTSNGTRILSGSIDGSVRVWDAYTGHDFTVPNDNTESITSVAFSKDGTHVLWGSADGYIRLWDITSTQAEAKMLKLEAIAGHAVLSVALSSDSSKIVSSSQDDSGVWLWDAVTGDQLGVMEGHTDWVQSVAFSGDSKQVVSGSGDKTIRLWDISDSGDLHSKVMEGHDDLVFSVAFSPDAARIISGSKDGSVRVWDTLTSTSLMILNGHTNWVRSVVFSNDGRKAVSGSVDNTVVVWDVSEDSAAQISMLSGRHRDGVNSVAISDDGTSILSGSWDGSVLIWGMDKPSWYFAKGNWIRSSSTNDRLMWVPQEANVLQRSNCYVVAGKYSFVDFERAMIGPDWWRCYTPLGEQQQGFPSRQE